MKKFVVAGHQKISLKDFDLVLYRFRAKREIFSLLISEVSSFRTAKRKEPLPIGTPMEISSAARNLFPSNKRSIVIPHREAEGTLANRSTKPNYISEAPSAPRSGRNLSQSEHKTQLHKRSLIPHREAEGTLANRSIKPNYTSEASSAPRSGRNLCQSEHLWKFRAQREIFSLLISEASSFRTAKRKEP